MQAAMEITAKYCQKEMEEYGACVASHPAEWQQQCQHLKVKVAQCTSSHPVIKKIRTDCAGEFAEFERCLRENQASAQTCSPHVVRFLACAETVDIKGLGNAVPQPT
ncbi:coiled-coil-helix-coiled-coil-helix domain-containing protein 5 isoform X1 [Pygocentrus nattereri]|uniref:IMS import disulfide relay-system CHCH-CHCH-like Cx9C domain-containing protein n=2 Tax=Pygocentrus nattereri TaxID=42514 RepID=A0A3B4CH50_PYGNA|nr:coiled-coil-helix-coiled-coil-helix domain-containing protein 5 isoform X1 [Pygocentrus nattereri]